MSFLQHRPFFSAHDGYRPVAFVLAGLVSVGAYVAVLHAPVGSRPGWVLEARKRAVETIRAGQAVILRERSRRRIPVSPADHLRTGIVGVSSSPITTELASAPAKRTSTNPLFGAVVVDMLYRAGVRPGDTVAVGMSGSFPSLNLSAEAAIEALGATPLAISSVGASQWGANEPSFSWPEIEYDLYYAGILRHRSIAVAVGGSPGEDDTSPGLRARRLAAEGSGLPVVPPLSLQEEVAYRVDMYERRAAQLSGPLKAFVNVGGSAVDIGPGDSGDVVIPAGLSRPRWSPFVASNLGVIGFLGRAGLPILNLRDVARLADRFDLPWDPRRPSHATDLPRPAPDPRAIGAALALILVMLAVAHRLGVFRFPDWSPPPALEAWMLRADAPSLTSEVADPPSGVHEQPVVAAERRPTASDRAEPE
jgi:poly-gamma-glutamate system protein